MFLVRLIDDVTTLDWPHIVHALQIFCAVTWLYPLYDKAGSVWRMLFGKPERWDAPWAAFWMLALTMVGFCVRWLVYPGAVEHMTTPELVSWAGLYISLAGTSIGMVYTQGLTSGVARNRRALIAHICTLLMCLATAIAVR